MRLQRAHFCPLWRQIMARAKKSICPVCKRVVAKGKKCPLSPHIMLHNGRVVRPIPYNALLAIEKRNIIRQIKRDAC